MAKLKVAIDISILGDRFDTVDPRHGIYNVTEEVLKEICKRSDIELTAIGISGENALADSMKAFLYLESQTPQLACSFRHTFRSNRSLTNLYTTAFRAMLPGGLDRWPQNSPKHVSLRIVRGLIHRMVYQYRVLNPRRVFDDQYFDVFHCPHLTLPLKELTGKVPRVITIYDLIPVVKPEFVTSGQASLFKTSLARIDAATDCVVCISEFTKREFCEYTNMSPDRCFVAPLAAGPSFRRITDPEAIRNTRARYGIPDGNYFLSLAAPQPRKNLAHLIRSFFRLLEERRSIDTYLVLAGSKEQGWMSEEIFATAASSERFRSRLIFTGYVHDSDLPVLYSDAVAFLFPSLYEGFGLPVLEAMACGTAVIASNTTSLPEVVGEAGLLIDPNDVNELCAAMDKLLTNCEERERLGRLGIARSSQFSWKRCADETAKAYHYAAGEKAKV